MIAPSAITLLRVFKEAGRWTVDCEGAATLLPSRRAALQSALDVAATVAPAVVLVFTTEGRVRLTIPVATGAGDSASSEDLVRMLCSRRKGRPGSGGTPCWIRPIYWLAVGQVCHEHALALVAERGLQGLQPNDRARFLAENPGYATG